MKSFGGSAVRHPEFKWNNQVIPRNAKAEVAGVGENFVPEDLASSRASFVTAVAGSVGTAEGADDVAPARSEGHETRLQGDEVDGGRPNWWKSVMNLVGGLVLPTLLLRH